MYVNSFVDYVRVKTIDNEEVPLYKLLGELIDRDDYVESSSYDLKVENDVPVLTSFFVRTEKSDITLVNTGHGSYLMKNER